jgi:MFS family permease
MSSDATAVTPKAGQSLAFSQFEDAVYRKVTWRLVPFLMICYVTAFLDRVNVGYAKLQMLDDLKFSNTVFGLGAGMFFIGYFLFEVPSNIALHKVGARLWIARIMVTWGIISACSIFVTTPMWFYMQRFLLGVAEAGFFPGIILYLTYWYPANRRAKIIAIFMIAIPISGFIGAPISGGIMQFFAGVQGLPGWKWMFIIEALPALVVGIWTMLYLDRGIRDAKWLKEEEKEVLERNIAEEASRKKEHPSLTALFTDSRIWLMSWIYFASVMGNLGLIFWMPTIVKALGIKSLFNVGLITAIPYAIAIVTMVVVGGNSDRTRERRWHTAGSMFVGGAGLIASVIAGNSHPVLAIIALSFAAGGIMTASPIFWSLPTAFLAGTAAAAGIAAINSVGNLSGFFGPFIIGWLKDLTNSTASGMYMLAVVQIAGGLTVLTLPRSVNK